MELSTRYTPEELEAPIYAAWEASGAFRPASDRGVEAGETFTVCIPPPNVTGRLHMGHALNGTIQDIVIRHRRKAGFDTLWIPGTDHAGIATQAVVEKMLYLDEKLTREDMGREAFLQRVWDWKQEYGDIILEQFRRLGCSCDWTRTAFTMDEKLSLAVREAFVRLFEQGLIYRGARLVNWDCALKTAVSDDEIEYVESKGKLWYLRYPLQARPGEFIVVATTRPETMLGDTGVAVHPEDARYKDLIGTSCVLPFLGREIPIVADESVEADYGTGAVKVTPGHDPADYERGARHKLPIINILETDGRINENGAGFAGLSREEARKRVVAELDELGLLEKVEDIVHKVSISDRSKTAIEPLVSEQWFVSMRPLAEPAIEAVREGWLQFRPERWSKVYLHWLENVHDWCISRQLWWGHQIPVWYDEDGTPVASKVDLEIGAAHPLSGKPITRREPDVLDTWASSWLFPLATLGWPDEQAPDLARFYPTQFLSTASEIIYLWVARMVMAGCAFLPKRPARERVPFSTCYIHATVLDSKGQRMSKSKGNGVDPLDMIVKYGADAVRFSLVLLTKEGQDVRLATDRFEQGARFCNKVWNASRFVMLNMQGERSTPAASGALEDRWILSRLERCRESVSLALDEYRFNDAANELYRFFWNELCDWYVELVKARLLGEDAHSAAAARATLARVLGDSLGLLHPFTPFLTEKLWEALHETLCVSAPSSLILAPWPDGAGLALDDEAEHEMELVQDLVRSVRRVRALTTLGERNPLAAIVSAPGAADRGVLEKHAQTIRSLGFLDTLEIHAAAERPPASAVSVAGNIETFVPLEGTVDLEKLKGVLEGRARKVAGAIEGVRKKLSNPSFVERADPEVVASERERGEQLGLELELLVRNLTGF